MFNRRWSLYYVKGFGALKMSCPRSRSAKKQKKANPKWLKKKSISHQVARTHVFHNEDSKKKNAFVRSVSSLTHGIASRKLAGLHQLCFVSLFLYPSQILPPISCEKLEKWTDTITAEEVAARDIATKCPNSTWRRPMRTTAGLTSTCTSPAPWTATNDKKNKFERTISPRKKMYLIFYICMMKYILCVPHVCSNGKKLRKKRTEKSLSFFRGGCEAGTLRSGWDWGI